MRRAISKLSMLNEGIQKIRNTRMQKYAQGKYWVTSSMMTWLMMKS